MLTASEIRLDHVYMLKVASEERYDDQFTMKDLERETGYHYDTVRHFVLRLVKHGLADYVTKKKGRGMFSEYALTDKGHRLAVQVDKLVKQLNAM